MSLSHSRITLTRAGVNVIVLGLTLWAAGALYFTLPLGEVRELAAVTYAIAAVGMLVGIRPLWKGAGFNRWKSQGG